MIETQRLVLRPWREADRAPFAAMMADPEVAYWLGGALDRTGSDAVIDRANAAIESQGVGRFAVERKADRSLIGMAGLMPIAETLPVAPGVEAGWRLARQAWGAGYASEAARATIEDGFSRLGFSEILAFTAVANTRSQAVMARLGFRRDASRDFDHPALPQDSELRRHIVYSAHSSSAGAAEGVGTFGR